MSNKNWHVGSEKQFHNINGLFAWIIHTMLYGIQQGQDTNRPFLLFGSGYGIHTQFVVFPTGCDLFTVFLDIIIGIKTDKNNRSMSHILRYFHHAFVFARTLVIFVTIFVNLNNDNVGTVIQQ